MTHDELLAKIKLRKQTTKWINAVFAVVELHKPTKEKIYGAYNCEECRKGNSDRWVQYPCRTIEAIEKELK